MRSVNKVILIGNLTRDPEMRETPNGQSVATFGLATNREWTTKDGRKQNSVEYHDLVAWAKLAEICEQYLKKGKLVYVEGYLKTRNWETPEGVKKFRTEIVVQDMIMLDKRGEGEDEMDYAETSSSEETMDTSSSEAPSSSAPESSPQEAPAEQPAAETSTEAAAEPMKEEQPPQEEKKEPVATASDSGSGTIDIDSDLGL
ncbi:MAG TPA: single-stranded DNA-binding protein [Candidatus Gracilibacteria bacterium]|nr:single-stranded DNA-binding protein [Candidatus Gracilibacteria bacterium]